LKRKNSSKLPHKPSFLPAKVTFYNIFHQGKTTNFSKNRPVLLRGPIDLLGFLRWKTSPSQVPLNFPRFTKEIDKAKHLFYGRMCCKITFSLQEDHRGNIFELKILKEKLVKN